MPSVAFPGISHDSRQLIAGGLYVAIKGERLDGHDFVDQAFASGASAAVVSSEYAARCTEQSRPLLVVADTRRALLDMASGYRRTLNGVVIGITGSVGKTTVKEMVAGVLSRKGRVVRTPGNWNNDLGLPLSILSMSPDDDYGVFEAGISHPGEMALLAGVLQPDWAVMTLVGAAHIGFFDSEEQIADEKAELFHALSSEGTAVIDVDQRWADRILSHASCRHLTVSSKGRKDTDYSIVEIGSRYALCMYDKASNRTLSCTMPLPGRHIMQNALLALSVGLSLGVDRDEACASVASFKPVGMRWQVEPVAGVQFVNDAYNANPMSMRAALAAFAEWPVRGKKWIVLGGMRELGASEQLEHMQLGFSLAKGPWQGLVTVGELGDRIAEGAEKAGMPARRICRCMDVREAACTLIAKGIAEGDAVLLKASRSEQLESVLALVREQSTDQSKG